MGWRIGIIAVISVIIMAIVFWKIILPIAEKKRIRKIKRKTDEIVLKYTPKAKNKRFTSRIFMIDREYLNNEVISAVKLLKDMISEKSDKCSAINNEINQILDSCSGLSEDEKYNYLISKTDELERLKSEKESIYKEISKFKIQIKNDDTKITDNVKSTFSLIEKSKKKTIVGSSFDEFICEKLPNEMKFFQFDVEPLTLHIDKFYYCLFSKFILVFDDFGAFVSAVEPSALSIKIEHLSKSILIYDDEIPKFDYDTDIDSDSKCIEHGETEHSWLYTRKDGGPDLRYKDNRMYKYRSDTYQYGKIIISIAGKNVTICLSSDNAICSFKMLGKIYNRKCIVKSETDKIAELLRLLDMVSGEEKKQIAKILQAHNSKMSRKKYFCEINV